jgi:hypothetical protein
MESRRNRPLDPQPAQDALKPEDRRSNSVHALNNPPAGCSVDLAARTGRRRWRISSSGRPSRAPPAAAGDFGPPAGFAGDQCRRGFPPEHPTRTGCHADFKRLTDLDLRGKRVFIRADLNVPRDDRLAITDDTRIRASVQQ